MKKTIDTEIEKFESELREMDEQWLVYSSRVRAMRDSVVKLKQK